MKARQLPIAKTVLLAGMFAFMLLLPAVGILQPYRSSSDPASTLLSSHVASASSDTPPSQGSGNQFAFDPYRAGATENYPANQIPLRGLRDLSSVPVTYHGGLIQQEQNVYAIFWLPSGDTYDPTGSNVNYENLISRYFGDIGGSNFYKMLVQYPDDINASPSATVNFGGAFVDTSAYPVAGNTTYPLSNQDIINEVQKIISSGSLPIGPDYSYYVFTANGTDSCENQGEGICSFQTNESPGYCAYHSYFDIGSTEVTFANMLDNPNGNSNCLITQSNYPNNDEYADSEISLVSQEQFDMASDPLLNAWYDSSSLEISAKCTGQYGLVNSTTGANIELNGHEYIVQEEWSNALSACTLLPPPTYSITLTLSPSTDANPISATNYFPVTYPIGDELFVVYYSGTPMTIQADPNTSLSIAAESYQSTTQDKWCLASSCQSYTISLDVPTQTSMLFYYNILAQSVSEATSDGSTPSTFASLSYTTAPSTASSSDSPLITSVTLSSTAQTIWVEHSTEASVASQTYLVSPTERYYTSAGTWNVTAPQQIPLTLSYHQFYVDYAYSILGGGTGFSVPTVVYFSGGQVQNSSAGAQYWSDSDTVYAYPMSLGGSSQTERWSTQSAQEAGTITSADEIQVTYYDQYRMTIGYQVKGGSGSSSPPTFTGQSFGSTIYVTPGQTPISYWLDANSNYSYTNPLSGSSSNERWYSVNATAGVVNASSTDIPIYVHQYSVSFVYSISGGGKPQSEPTLLYSSLNGTNTIELSGTPEAIWINAGSNYTVNSAVSSNATERWAYNSGQAVANGWGTISVTLYHQFEVEFNVTYAGGGNSLPSTFPVLNTTMFGEPMSIQITGSKPVTMWIDAGSTYDLSSSLGQSQAQRWLTPTPTGVVNENATLSITYYNQYEVSLDYSVTGGGSPSGGPVASFISLGKTLSVQVNQTSGQVWADAASKYFIPSTLPGSSSQEQWATNSTEISGVISSGLGLSIQYDHEYYVSITSDPAGIGVFSVPSGWFEPGASLVVQTITPRAWQFEGWTGQGQGSYTGNESSLLLAVTGPIMETATMYTAFTITTSSMGSVSYSYGQISGSVGQGQTRTVFVPPDQTLKITADPIPVIFGFSYWNGNLTGGPNATRTNINPLVLQLTAPSSVSVAFKINLVGIIAIVIVVVLAVVGVMMFLRRGRTPEDSFSEEKDDSEEMLTKAVDGPS